jgi:hypothetical protein
MTIFPYPLLSLTAPLLCSYENRCRMCGCNCGCTLPNVVNFSSTWSEFRILCQQSKTIRVENNPVTLSPKQGTLTDSTRA